MIEKMLLEYDKLHKQRALLMSGMLSFMTKNFEDEEVNAFKFTIAKQFIDMMFEDDGGMLLDDMTEAVIFKSMETFLSKEKALMDIKSMLNKIQ